MPAFAHSILETVRHPILLLDDSLRVRLANAAFYRTFRTERDKSDGIVLYDLDEGQWDIPGLRTLLADVIPGGSFEDFEVTHDFPRLGRRVMLLNARRVCRDEDGTEMVLLAIEDVTDRAQVRDELQVLNRELEDRVRERTAELEAANKELEVFCYSVSHDLRAPLRALDGFADELLRRYAEQLDAKGQHYLQRVRAGTQRMGRLIDDLLQLSRLSRGALKRDRIDLTALANAVVSDLRQQEPNRSVVFEVEPGLTVQGDHGLLKIVLENLLGNAWKFTSKKPGAIIKVGRAEKEGRPSFFVRDDGAGFDMSHADKLFGAFQRLHPEREFPGNGIGLATVQRIIRRHGGEVWADALPGKGATFYFNLPAEEGPS